MKDNAIVVVALEERQWKCGGDNGGERQRNCDGSRRGKTMEIWWF